MTTNLTGKKTMINFKKIGMEKLNKMLDGLTTIKNVTCETIELMNGLTIGCDEMDGQIYFYVYNKSHNMYFDFYDVFNSKSVKHYIDNVYYELTHETGKITF